MQFNLVESIEILSKTPEVISSLLRGLSEPWIKTNEGSDTWSPYDVVGHLIHGEKTDWIPRAMVILNQDEDKTFKPFDRFAQFEESQGKTLEELLNEFHELRTMNLEKLKGMNIDDQMLNQQGIHPEFGPVTLKQLLATWVVHDLGHIHQITRVMAKNYTVEVGPWTNYLSILQNKND
ncbi:MAG: DinB family protein [Bacteroidota bacterium]